MPKMSRSTARQSHGVYYLRFLVLWSGEETNPTVNVLQNSGLAENQVFTTGTAPNTIANAVTNPKSCTILADRTYMVNSQIDTRVDGLPFSLDVNLKGVKFNYQSAGSVYGKSKSLYIVVVPSAYDGSVNTDAKLNTAGAAGNIVYNYQLLYLDS